MAKKYKLSDFGLLVKIELLKCGMSQTELAKKIGISGGYLSDILKGSRKSAKIEDSICEILSIQQYKEVPHEQFSTSTKQQSANARQS
jgi:transcriptional regulator with XRE-family HTH domain